MILRKRCPKHSLCREFNLFKRVDYTCLSFVLRKKEDVEKKIKVEFKVDGWSSSEAADLQELMPNRQPCWLFVHARTHHLPPKQLGPAPQCFSTLLSPGFVWGLLLLVRLRTGNVDLRIQNTSIFSIIRVSDKKPWVVVGYVECRVCVRAS